MKSRNLYLVGSLAVVMGSGLSACSRSGGGPDGWSSWFSWPFGKQAATTEPSEPATPEEKYPAQEPVEGPAKKTPPMKNTAEQAPSPPREEGCFKFAYQLPDPKLSRQLGRHRHVFELKHEEANKKSVCVKVDGKPVAFTWDGKTKVVTGPILAASPKVTLQYCLWDTGCSEKCQVPKDEFMESIGGISKDLAKADGNKAKWDPKSKDGDEPDLRKELKGLLDDDTANAIQKMPAIAWQRDQGAPACMQAKFKDTGKSGRSTASAKKK